MKNNVRNVLAALVLCMSAIALPVTAYASTGSDTTPPTLSATLNNDKLAVEASDTGCAFPNARAFSFIKQCFRQFGKQPGRRDPFGLPGRNRGFF